MYALYPNIIFKIKKTLKKLNLTLLSEAPEMFVEKKLRFYHAICQTKKGEKVFFKSLLKRERDIKNRFSNEINFLKTLKEKPRYPLAKFVPLLLDFSLDPSFLYLLYKFLPGETKERESRFSKEEIKEIARLMKIINSSENIFNFTPKRPLFSLPSYRKRVSSLFKKIKLKKEIKRKIEDFIEKNQKIFYQVKPTLTHGDFSESNLIFCKGKIKIVDWEHVQLRNPLYDLASFWVKRKSHLKEQKELKREYLRKEGKSKFFSPLFKLALIKICLQDLSFFEEMLKILKEDKRKDKIIKIASKERKEEIKKTIKLLEKEIS